MVCKERECILNIECHRSPKNHIIVFKRAKHHAPVFFHMTRPEYTLQGLSTLLEIVWSVLFSHLNTSGSSIFLGNMHSFVKSLY